jgi:sensor histidine kinase regulating citrate/malate metabolism
VASAAARACQAGDDMVSDKNSGVISINASGIIQMANKAATQLLG